MPTTLPTTTNNPPSLRRPQSGGDFRPGIQLGRAVPGSLNISGLPRTRPDPGPSFALTPGIQNIVGDVPGFLQFFEGLTPETQSLLRASLGATAAAQAPVLEGRENALNELRSTQSEIQALAGRPPIGPREESALRSQVARELALARERIATEQGIRGGGPTDTGSFAQDQAAIAQAARAGQNISLRTAEINQGAAERVSSLLANISTTIAGVETGIQVEPFDPGAFAQVDFAREQFDQVLAEFDAANEQFSESQQVDGYDLLSLFFDFLTGGGAKILDNVLQDVFQPKG